MDFAVTERGTFERCEAQAVYTSKNGQHLTPLISPVSLSLGSLMHKGFQYWLEDIQANGGTGKTRFHDHIMRASIELRERTITRYVERVGAQPSNSEMLPVYESIQFGLAMSENYQTHWGSPIPEGWRLIKAEQKIVIDIPGTEHTCIRCGGSGDPQVEVESECAVCNGAGFLRHRLTGRIDAMFQHIATGRIDIDEHKTYKNRPNPDALAYNDQFTTYEMLVEALNLNVGHDSAYIMYDGMWRRETPPRGAKFEDLFARYQLRSPKERRDRFRAELPRQLNEMAALYIDPDLARHTIPWNGCPDCGMRKLCHAELDGEPSKMIRQHEYIERDDDTDEGETE